MEYSEKIEAYINGSMSSLEQFIFEQELSENADLKAAYEAHLLVDDLLNFTANNLSEAQILSSKTIPAPNVSTSSWMPYLGLLVIGLIGLLSFLFLVPSSKSTLEKSTATQQQTPVVESSAQETIAPMPTPPKVKVAPKASEIFIDPAKDITPVPVPVTKPVTKKAKASKPIAANTILPEIEPLPIKQPKEISITISSQEFIASGTSKVLKAKESITLSPGFAVEAGASFQAVID